MNNSKCPFQKLNSTYQSSLITIKVYYFVLLGLMFTSLLPGAFNQPFELNPNLMWPISFLSAFNFKIAFVTCVLAVMLFSGLAGLFPKIISFRFFTFIFLLFSDSFQNSTGAKTHIYQFWLWSAFFLSLTPGIFFPWQQLIENRIFKVRFLVGFWGATSIVLLFYFLSGTWKVIGMARQFFNDEPHLLSESGLVYHIASEIIRAGVNPIAFNFLNEYRFFNPILGFMVIAIQLSAILGIFKGKFLPLIGICLLSFHIGTYFILAITYPPNVFLVGILFCASPLKHNLKFPFVRKKPWLTRFFLGDLMNIARR